MTRLLALLICGAMWGRAQSFEAASIKPLKEPFGPFHYTVLPNRLDAKNLSLGVLISRAYDLADFQLSGPDWIYETSFDIVATSGAPVSPADMRAMLQNLLRERFHLEVHWVSRREAVFRLVVLPSGPTMKVSEQGYPAANSPMRDGGTTHLTGPMSMRQLAGRLTRFTGKTVVDETNLEGYFSIALAFASPDYDFANDKATLPAPPLNKAVEEQLGLKLVAVKEELKILIVDHVDRMPAEN
jgi:uncharacterized protein (TIGR03435 family)